MAVTRINNNQISDASTGNTYVGINAAVKLQSYSITATKIANNLTYGSDLTIAGNLTVQGNTTTIDTTYTTIEDPILLLASNQTGSPSVDIGFVGERGTSQNVAFVWDESAGEFITAYTATGESNTTISIASYADIHSGNANVGSNLVVNGTTSLVGNLIGAVNATGNITGGNLLTPGQVDATGAITSSANIIGANLNTAGQVVATGNVSGGNINTAGQVVATGNITGGNLITSGTFQAASITATGNITGGNLISNDKVISTGNITSSANVQGANVIATANLVSVGAAVSGNVTGGNLLTPGQVVATGNITTVANIAAGNLNITGAITTSGNLNVGNLNATYRVAGATGYFTGNVDVLGNLNATIGVVYANSGIFYGNAVTGNNAAFAGIPGFTPLGSNVVMQFAGNANSYSQLNFQNINNGTSASTDYIATADNGDDSNYYVDLGINSSTFNDPVDYPGFGPNDAYVHNHGGNLILNPETTGKAINFMVGGTDTTDVIGYVDATGLSVTGTTSVTGNITGGNLITAGQVVATGNVTGGNVNTAGQAVVTGNITGGNVSTAGQVTATGNVTGGNLLTGGIVSATGNITSAANISGGNLIVTSAVHSATLTTTGNLFVGGNLTVQGNITYQNVDDLRVEDPVIILGTGPNGAPLTQDDNMDRGVYMEYYTTGLGNAWMGWQNSSGNMIAAASVSFSGNNVVNVNEYGTFQAGNIYAQSAVTSGNITGGNLNTAGQVVATGNVTGGNLVTAGAINAGSISAPTITATGNITGGNLLTGGLISATGNITSSANVQGANVIGTTSVSAPTITGTTATLTGNITGGNLLTGGLISATGNITSSANVQGANLIATANLVSVGAVVSGNVTGGNLLTAGLVSATGNITSSANVQGANVIATANLVSVGAVVSGNVTGGNLLTAGLVSATGNITGGNLGTAGQVTATANITGGNLLTGGLISATGNITSSANVQGANVIATANLVSVGAVVSGNVTGGNLLTAGIVSATGNILSAANVNGANVNATTAVVTPLVTTTTIAASGNITGANINTGGANGLTLNASTINSNAARITVNSNSSDVDFAINGDTVANVFYVDAGTGTVSIGSATQTTNAALAINATNSMLIPVGSTGQRPSTGVTGMIRFNSTTDAVEIYDSNEWTTVGTPSFTVISDDQFSGDGSTVLYTLANAYTTNSVIVSINGVLQIPTSAYSVTGNALTFTEAPESGDLIDVRGLTTTTEVVAISNSPGTAVVQPNATLAQVDITGNLTPTADLTYNLGAPSLRWNELYLSGNTITLGNIVIKDVGSNQIGFFQGDGTTPATIDSDNVDTTQIASGTSSVAVIASGGNIRANVGGSTIQTISSSGVAIIGDLSVTGNATLSGNILGDRVQNGTTSFDIQTQSGNANITVGGTSNVAVFSTAGANVSGTLGVTGNITGGNLVTAGQVVATGNVSAGNVNTASKVTASTLESNVATGTAPLTVSSTTLVTNLNADLLDGYNTASTNTGSTVVIRDSSGNFAAGTITATLSGAATTAGTVTTAAQPNITSVGTLTSLSVSANISGGNLSVGTGTITVNNIVNGGSNGVGNIGSSTTYFNTVFAKATSAQYADLAEYYAADANYEPGTVVSFGGTAEVTQSTVAGDARIAGVISTNPSYIMNSTLTSEFAAIVALTGRVPTRVVGPVVKGDMMVSNGDGSACACATPTIGTVIGKALENFNGDRGVIEVVVGRL